MDTCDRNSVEDILNRYRSDVALLVPYLPWLDAHADKEVSGLFSEERMKDTIDFPVYDSNLLAFIDQAGKTAFIDRNYVYVYSRNHIRTAADELKLIERADIMDMNDLTGIISRYVLEGMTRGNVWSMGVRNHVLYSAVAKMQELIDFWSKDSRAEHMNTKA